MQPLAQRLCGIMASHASETRLPKLVDFLSPSWPFPALSVQELKQRGFSVKAGKTSAWSVEEEQSMLHFFKALLKDEISMHNEDKYIFISRHVLAGSKSGKEVKKYILHMMKEHNKKKHNK